MKRILLLCGLLLTMWTVLENGAMTVRAEDTISAEVNHRAPISYDPIAHEPDWIEIKFNEGTAIRLRDGELVDLNRDDTLREPAVADVLASVANGTWQRTHTVSEVALDQMRTDGIERTRETLPDLNLYFRLQLPDGMTPDNAIAQFAMLSIVERVYPVQRPTSNPLPPVMEQLDDDNINFPDSNVPFHQKYLNPSPEGIDAEFAWETGVRGRGDGITICDLEYNYNAHADLPAVPIINGTPWLDDGNHGTAVLGVMGARNNDWGITGIASRAQYLFATTWPAVSVFGYKIPGTLNVAAAITACADALDEGDIIIIEAQTSGPNGACTDPNDQTGCLPVEWIQSNYDAIKSAVAQGIVVIEAAGNGNQDLDLNIYDVGHRPFSPANDSGAIIVGSSFSDFTDFNLQRNTSSNYGATVDMFAWGMHIAATGYGSAYGIEGPQYWYGAFGGTSGASPIVAASAAIVQSTYENVNGSYASPATVKSILQNTGTAQVNENGENIGWMPDLKAAINQINGAASLPAPIITPNGGQQMMPLEIDIDYGDTPPANSNNQMRYTLDGSEPTEDSFIIIPEFGDTLTLAYGATLKVKAWRYIPATGTYLESETATATFVSTTPKVATPQISTGGGTFTAPYQVVITSNTPGTTIRYRTDGKTIGLFRPGTLYTGPITLQAGTYKISAVAYKDGYYKSDQVKSAEFEVVPVTLSSPSIYPPDGQYQGSVTVNLSSSTLGGTIRYTLDGSTPTANSPIYTEPIEIFENATVKARVYLSGYTESATVSATYTVIAQASTPTISPPDGSTANDFINITMASTTPGAEIRYTTNGADPQPHSSLYSGQLTLGIGVHTIKARAFLDGAEASEITTVNYTVFDLDSLIDPPNITPLGGNHNGPIMMTLQSDTDVDFMFYTLDGTDPQSSTTFKVYSGPVELVGDETYFVRARAYKSGIGNSNMSFATIVVVNPTLGQVQAPTISKESGTYNNAISVQVAAPDFLSPFRIRRLFITQDGTEPVVDFGPSGGAFSNPKTLSISSPQTVKAVAAQSGWFNSDVTLAQYGFQCGLPIITDGGTFTDTVSVSISTVTSSASIRYTTDGSEPTATSTPYGSPFSLGVGEHIVNAKCFRNNFDDSETATSAFIVNETPTEPAIDQQPRAGGAAIDQCDSATLSVSATGTAPLAYQWMKDGSLLAGEIEPELVIAAAQAGNAGSYTVSVSNGAGTVTSNAVNVTVNPTGAQCTSVPTAVSMVGGLISAENTPIILLTILLLVTSISLRSRRLRHK